MSSNARYVKLLCSGSALATALASCGLDDRSLEQRDPVRSSMEGDGSAMVPSDAAAPSGEDPIAPRGGRGGHGGDAASGRGGASGASGSGALDPPDAGSDRDPDSSLGGDPQDEDGGDRDAAVEPPPPCTVGNTLQPVDGWVDGSTNCAAIQGRVRIDWRDQSFINVTLWTTDVCAEGFSEEAEPSAFDTSFALSLNEDALDASGASDYDAVAHGVVGFEFVVEPPMPLPYFGVISDGVLYCTRTAEVGSYRVALSELHAECWSGDSGPTPDPRKLRSIGFYSGATLDDPANFQFCVTDIVALTTLE
jgi:hypothetical protein